MDQQQQACRTKRHRDASKKVKQQGSLALLRRKVSIFRNVICRAILFSCRFVWFWIIHMGQLGRRILIETGDFRMRGRGRGRGPRLMHDNTRFLDNLAFVLDFRRNRLVYRFSFNSRIRLDGNRFYIKVPIGPSCVITHDDAEHLDASTEAIDLSTQSARVLRVVR